MKKATYQVLLVLMAVYETLPSTNLRMEDVRDTLNANGGSVKNELVEYFTLKANINMWSRRKPVRYAKNHEITEEDRKSVSYGIEPPQAINFEGNPSFTTQKWAYKLPQGGSSSPYRLSDFRGYYSKAIPPLVMSATEYVYDRGLQSLENFYLSAYFKINSSSSFGSTSGMDIYLSDFKIGLVNDLSTRYWGIAYIWNNTVFVANAANNFKQSNGSEPPVVYPSRFPKFKELIEGLSINGYIDVFPVINMIETKSSADSGGTSTLYSFPAGSTVRIKKTFTPLAVLNAQNNIGIFNAVTGKYLGFMTNSSASPGFGSFSRITGQDYRIAMAIAVTNPRSESVSLSASSFFLSFPSKLGISASGNGIVTCNGIINRTSHGFGSSDLTEESPKLNIVLAPGEKKYFSICAVIPYSRFNSSFSFVSGVPTQGTSVIANNMSWAAESVTTYYQYKVSS